MIIKTSRQLKDKISNLSGNDSKKAQTLIRKYMMERFLVRIQKMQLTVRRVLVYIQVASLRSANTSTRLTKLNRQNERKQKTQRQRKSPN